LTELYETGQQHDAQQQEHAEKMLNLEPETAQFLNILIRSSRRTGYGNFHASTEQYFP